MREQEIFFQLPPSAGFPFAKGRDSKGDDYQIVLTSDIEVFLNGVAIFFSRWSRASYHGF